MTALHLFGAEMLKLSRGLESVNVTKAEERLRATDRVVEEQPFGSVTMIGGARKQHSAATNG